MSEHTTTLGSVDLHKNIINYGPNSHACKMFIANTEVLGIHEVRYYENIWLAFIKSEIQAKWEYNERFGVAVRF